jgi:hypothetical protein
MRKVCTNHRISRRYLAQVEVQHPVINACPAPRLECSQYKKLLICRYAEATVDGLLPPFRLRAKRQGRTLTRSRGMQRASERQGHATMPRASVASETPRHLRLSEHMMLIRACRDVSCLHDNASRRGRRLAGEKVHDMP